MSLLHKESEPIEVRLDRIERELQKLNGEQAAFELAVKWWPKVKAVAMRKRAIEREYASTLDCLGIIWGPELPYFMFASAIEKIADREEREANGNTRQ
jgi:hypothetical protein